MALDDSLNRYVSIGAVEALCALAVEEKREKEKIVQFCRRFIEQAEEHFVMRSLTSLSEVPDEELFREIKAFHRKSSLAKEHFNLSELRKIHEGTSEYKPSEHTTKDVWDHFSQENLKYLYELNYGRV